MKKFNITILVTFSLLLSMAGIIWPIETLKTNNDSFAAITLPDELKPKYAPEIEIETSGPGGEADYANYFLQLIAGGLLYLAAPSAVLIIAISGLRYAIAHGDQTQMDGAKKTLTWAIIGLVIIILSFAIVKAIINIMVAL